MAVKVFLAYTFKDEAARNELIHHLYQLRSRGLISEWEERATGQSSTWTGEVSPSLNEAQLILFLLSPDFIHSAYCYSADMEYALQRLEAGLARVLLILTRPVEREDTPLASLPVLPADGRAVSLWPDRAAAWQQIAETLEEMLSSWNEHGWSSFATESLVSDSRPLPVWQVPARRNTFFTGREALLRHLHDVPISNKASAVTPPQVLSGPAGSGKTQVALEYVYRYGHEYTAVLWANAASRQILIYDLVRIAGQLDLPERVMPNQRLAALAVRRWLETTPGWLLVLDNASDGELLREFLPVGGRGHVLILTRQPLGLPSMLSLPLAGLSAEEAALLLLRRAGILAPEAPLEAATTAEIARAGELVSALQALPLALTLAGAYIDTEQCSLSSYLNLYKEACLVQTQSAGGSNVSLQASAAVTLAIALKRVERLDREAVALLRLCTFLQPDAIPLELLISGSTELEESLRQMLLNRFALLKTIHGLRRFALLDFTQNRLSMHRLISTGIQQRLSRESRQLWAEQTLRLVEAACAHGRHERTTGLQVDRWSDSQEYLPHLLTCVRWIEHCQIGTPEAARLLERTGTYLQRYRSYQDAEPLLHRALALREQQLGPAHPELIASLCRLALFYEEQGRLQEAEQLYNRALTITEKEPQAELQRHGKVLYHLALIYRERRDFARAEPLFLRVLDLWRRERGSEHPAIAALFNELAALYRAQGDYIQAEQLYRRALVIRERALGSEHPAVAQTISALGSLYHAQGMYEQAEQCYLQALAVHEQAPLHEQLDLATTLNNLALLYRDTARYGQAELLYQRALTIYRQLLGEEHPYTASCLENLAILYHDRGELERAELFYQSALQIREHTLGDYHPALAVNLNNLATLYTAWQRHGQARLLFKRALEIAERTFGTEHPTYARFLENYALLLQQTRQMTKAVELKTRARAIRARQAEGLSLTGGG